MDEGKFSTLFEINILFIKLKIIKEIYDLSNLNIQ